MRSTASPRLVAIIAFAALAAAAACTEAAEDTSGDDDLQVGGKADTANDAATRGWRIDRRVSSQVGIHVGRDGSGQTTAPSAYDYVGVLSLPAGALLGNAIWLVDVAADDLAQIDFYRMHAENSIGLRKMLRGFISEFGFSEDVAQGVGPALETDSVLLKEVRLRQPAEDVLPPALSKLPNNQFAAFERVNYTSIFIRRPSGATTGPSAIDAFHTSALAGSPAYEVGDVNVLPGIPHPEQADISLIGLMTLRFVDPVHGRLLVLEVIETQ